MTFYEGIIHHNDVDPMDWAVEKCNALPLSAWDADEDGGAFRVADRIARIQMTVGLYAVQLLTDAGRVLDRGKLRTFAEKVWDHADFVRQYGDLLVEDSVAAEFAARVAAAFGEPDQVWVLQQANSPAIDPQILYETPRQRRVPRQCVRGNPSNRIGPIHQFSRRRTHSCAPQEAASPRNKGLSGWVCGVRAVRREGFGFVPVGACGVADEVVVVCHTPSG